MSSGFDILNGAQKKLLICCDQSLLTFCMQFGAHSHSSPVSYKPFRSQRNSSGVRCFVFYSRRLVSYSLLRLGCLRVLGISWYSVLVLLEDILQLPLGFSI